MPKLQILHLEDNLVDAELFRETLDAAGLACDILRVDSEPAFSSALQQHNFDLIISDFSLPGFDGKSALNIASTNYPETPFVFVSGTIGEDAAIESLVSGATDYVLKHKFSRLVPAIQRVLREANEKKSRHKAEQAIRESEEKYRRLFEESKDAIFIHDGQGRFIDMNPAGIEMLGYSRKEEVQALNMPGNLYQEPAKWNELRKKIDTQGYVRDFEVVLNRKDGSSVIVLETTTAIKNEQGDIVRFDGIWHDVTEQRKLEAQFLRTQRLENIGKLASGIAHDLNNILAPVLMGIDLLRTRVGDSGSISVLDTMQSSGKRGADLVKQILAFARGVKIERVPLQLRHLVRDVEKIMRETSSKNIQIVVDAPRELWTVVADGTQMHQVLMNLCINARDAMPAGGTLTISAGNVTLNESLKRWGLEIQPGSYVTLQVTDTGTGIPSEVLDKIFEPFFTTKELGKGTGLGLSTVQVITKAHSGLVDIISVPGRGTVVIAYIPARGPQEETAETETAAPPPGNGELILVVDDEAAIRDIARATLEAFGYRVITASDGAEALALFVQNKDELKLVVSDVNMPVLDGRVFIQSLERIDPSARVICASGSAPGVGGDMPVRQGVVRAHLEKPFTTEELLRTVASVIKMPEATAS
jgi:two-component system, cell cycle sensor histidine kinase and response regulator CckA